MTFWKVFIVGVIQLLFISIISAQPEWEATGKMYGADVRNLELTPNGTLFAGLQNGSLYRKKPADDLWERLWVGNNTFDNNGFRGLLAINDSLIFCSPRSNPHGGSIGSLLKSTNGGENWVVLYGAPRNGNLQKNQSNHLFYLTSNLAVSTDFGDSWTTYDIGNNVFSSSEVSFANNDSTWIIGSSGGILVSTNYGNSWEERNIGGSHLTKSLFVDSNNGVYAGTNKGIYYTKDFGLNWQPRITGLPSSCNVWDLFGENDTIIISGTSNGFYLSGNAGESWENLQPSNNYLSVYKVIQLNGSFIAATSKGIVRINSTSYNFFDDGICDAYVYRFQKYSGKLYASTHYGLFYTTNFGNSWQIIPQFKRTATNNLTNSDEYLFLNQDELYYSSDGVTNWMSTQLPARCYSLQSLKNNILLAGLMDEYYYSPPSWYDLWKSTNFGETWQSVSTPGLFLAQIFYINKDIYNNYYFLGYSIVDYSDYIYRSANNGMSFSNFNQGFSTNNDFDFYKIVPDSIGNLYLSTSEGIYFRSEADSEWALRGLSGYDVQYLVVDSAGIVYAVADSKLYYSYNFALSFTLFEDGLPNVSSKSLFYDHETETLYLGTKQGVFKRSRPDIVPVKVKPNHNVKLPNEFVLSQNYPNPFNPSTTIIYTIAKESFVSLKIYDVLGKEIAALVNERQAAGNYSVSFDFSEANNESGISSGIYFYRLSAGGLNETKKMILLR